MSTMIRSDTVRNTTVVVAGANIQLELVVPDGAVGLVILAYATANARSTLAHRHLAQALNRAGFATACCDLLTTEEEMLGDLTGEFRRDVPLLAARLAAVVDWCRTQAELREMAIGILGVGTCAPAAFVCAAQRPEIRAIVARGGRFDLAGTALGQVVAPVLLVAGENNAMLRDIYRTYLPYIGSNQKEISVVPCAATGFSMEIAPDKFAEQSVRWFAEHLDEAWR